MGGPLTGVGFALPMGGPFTGVRPALPVGGPLTGVGPALPVGGALTGVRPALPVGGPLTGVGPALTMGGPLTGVGFALPVGGTFAGIGLAPAVPPFPDGNLVVFIGGFLVGPDIRLGGLPGLSPADGFLNLAAQCGKLRFLQLPPFARRQHPETDRSDRGAAQPRHLQPELLAHPADLAVLSFMQHQLHHRPVRLLHDHTGGDGLAFLAVQHDSLQELEGVFLGEVGTQGCTVDLRHMVARMHKLVGQLPVVGQQKQTLAVPVQPSDGVDASGNVGDQIGDAAAPLFVGHRGDVPPGLIEHNVPEPFVLLDPDPVHGDDVTAGVDGHSEPGRTSVDRYASGFNQLLRPPAGGDAGLREKFLETYLFHCSFLC